MRILALIHLLLLPLSLNYYFFSTVNDNNHSRKALNDNFMKKCQNGRVGRKCNST